jgi:hypothetical protein
MIMNTTEERTIAQDAENWALNLIDHYDNENFQDMYWDAITDDIHYNTDSIEFVLHREFGVFSGQASTAMLEEIADYVKDNHNDFCGTFSNYWVGNYCLASISFGEQEEEVPEEYLASQEAREAIDKAGFYINDDGYAYYDMSSSGIMYSMTPDSTEWNAIRDIVAKHRK